MLFDKYVLYVYRYFVGNTLHLTFSTGNYGPYSVKERKSALKEKCE